MAHFCLYFNDGNGSDDLCSTTGFGSIDRNYNNAQFDKSVAARKYLVLVPNLSTSIYNSIRHRKIEVLVCQYVFQLVNSFCATGAIFAKVTTILG